VCAAQLEECPPVFTMEFVNITEYAYHVYETATHQTNTGMKEGLGILSRYPIITTS
jgi:hypothetical protein